MDKSDFEEIREGRAHVGLTLLNMLMPAAFGWKEGSSLSVLKEISCRKSSLPCLFQALAERVGDS